MSSISKVSQSSFLQKFDKCFEVKNEKNLKVYRFALIVIGLISLAILATPYFAYLAPLPLIGAAGLLILAYKKLHISNVKEKKVKYPYKNLNFNKSHEEALRTMLTLLSQDSYMQIIKNTSKIYRAQRALARSHTLRQLGFIFSDKDLKGKFIKIVNNEDSSLAYVKKKFIDGYAKGFEAYHRKGRIVNYLSDFVNDVYSNKNVSFFKKRALVNALYKKSIENKNSSAKWQEFIELVIKDSTK
ncbi:MAG: hypothetical protein JXA94_01290 [Parachlamydiales bacterium]|nr:hypothetical protein [Parachlamydiales bacterium]